jgi:hypothetical protein
MIHADRNYTQLRDYLAGRLPDHECRLFEDRLQFEPNLARELDLSLKVKAGLELLQSQNQLAVPGFRHPLSLTKRLIAAAATIACVALLLWVWTHPATGPAILLSTTDPGPQAGHASHVARPIVAHYSFIAMRDSSTPDLDLPADGLIELRVAPAHRAPRLRYTMRLIAREPTTARTLAALNDLTAGADGYVRGYADASKLRPGTYELQLDTGSAADRDVFTFSLHSAPPIGTQ